ncbi:Sorbitol dehydrogenase [Chionoecetes opilio]|uniref:Sorbitol dehydrogenase n=1 Tax=Chionoecetes opilio TaxID=41210 RepID=A0A8J4XLN8_CHIOP|nr:Sorbitol dehydrogenase [Chionoecetes opilio]
MEDNLTAVLYAAQDLRLEQRSIPQPGHGEVLVRVASVGICGSDVHYWWRGRTARFVVEAPLVLGHESSATVITCGPGVRDLKPGDRVAIEPGVPCRRCDHCRGGRYNVCPEVKFCATPPVDGTLTRYYVHPADFCFKLPDTVSDEEGAMLEPLAVAVYSCRRAEVGLGTPVLVLGAGPIGLVALLTAKAMGAGPICVTDINESRLQFAKTLGANHTINVSGRSPKEVADAIQVLMPRRPAALIECSGADSSYVTGLLAGAPGGIMVTVGRGNPDVTLPMNLVTAKEMEIRGIFRYANWTDENFLPSWAYASSYPAALALVASGRVDVRPLITDCFTLRQVEEAFHAARNGVAIKVMIRVQQDDPADASQDLPVPAPV